MCAHPHSVVIVSTMCPGVQALEFRLLTKRNTGESRGCGFLELKDLKTYQVAPPHTVCSSLLGSDCVCLHDLHYPSLPYSTLHHTTPHCTTLHYSKLHYTALPYPKLHYTTPHYTALPYTTLHYTTLHYPTPHYTTLHYTTPHYSTLHYTALPYALHLCIDLFH